MTMQDETLEAQIAQWRAYLRRRPAIRTSDAAELESHLRDQVTALGEAGLAADEAFLVAVKRMGNLDAVSREFAREHSERLWKQLVTAPTETAEAERTASSVETAVVVGLAAAAALAVKLPELFGYPPLVNPDEEFLPFYFRNLGFFVLPLLAGYFAWKRRMDRAAGLRLAVAFAVGALAINVFPFTPYGHTQTLAALHLPIALWLAVGVAYVGGRWRDAAGRMDFVRFTGELFIYYVLMALGGGVLTGFTLGAFAAIGVDVERFAQQWLLPCGAMGAVIVGAWLVEAKQSVIENMAPVLTRLFTPLFAAVLIAFLATMIWTGSGIDFEREVLIAFDLLAGDRPRPAALRRLGARSAGAARWVRRAAASARGQRPGRRRRGADRHRRPHLRVRVQPEPGGGPGREPGPAGQSRLVGLAVRPLPRRPRFVLRAGALADRLSAGLRRLGPPSSSSSSRPCSATSETPTFRCPCAADVRTISRSILQSHSVTPARRGGRGPQPPARCPHRRRGHG